MNVYQFASQMTGHLAWPLMATIALIVFRRPIAKRIEQLRSVSAGKFAAEFGETERQVEQALEAEAARPVEITPSGDGGDGTGDGDGGNEEVRQASGLETSSQTAARGDLDPVEERFRELALAAEDNPSYAVVASWSLLEDVMADALETIGSLDEDQPRRFPRHGAAVLEELGGLGAVTPATLRALHGLRRLRNEVAHGTENPAVGAATGYVESARTMAAAVRLAIDSQQA